MFFKSRDGQTIALYQKENARLKRENETLRTQLDTLGQYRADYKLLIEKLQDLKSKYQASLDDFAKLKQSYKHHLDEIIAGME